MYSIIKYLITLLIVVGAGWVGYTYLKQGTIDTSPKNPPIASSTAPVAIAPVDTTSDAALSGELINVDAQVDAAQLAASSSEQSFTDTPVAQTE